MQWCNHIRPIHQLFSSHLVSSCTQWMQLPHSDHRDMTRSCLPDYNIVALGTPHIKHQTQECSSSWPKKTIIYMETNFRNDAYNILWTAENLCTVHKHRDSLLFWSPCLEHKVFQTKWHLLYREIRYMVAGQSINLIHRERIHPNNVWNQF